MDYFILSLAITSLILAIAALTISLKSMRKKQSELIEYEIVENTPEIEEIESSEAGEPEVEEPEQQAIDRKISSLAEAAVMLGARALLLFDLQGMAIDSYNISEGDEAKTAASMAELIHIARSLGFSTEAVILKNGIQSMIVELGKVGEMTLYGLLTGSKLKTDTSYVRNVLQKYLENITGRGG